MLITSNHIMSRALGHKEILLDLSSGMKHAGDNTVRLIKLSKPN